MDKSIKAMLLDTYPPILSLENVRVILRISKRKASWMLHNGYIKCTISEKKTRNYKVRIEDLFEYIDKVEQLAPEVQMPSGLFSARQPQSHHNEPTIAAPNIIHQQPPQDFAEWLADDWFDVDELLQLKDVPKLIGYTEKTIQEWGQKKLLQTAWSQNMLFTTRDWVIEFLINEGYKVKNKSPLHTQLLLRYYNR